MRIPQVPERMKEAPTQALRAVFAGIGQLLLVAERIKNKPSQQDPDEPPHAERQVRGRKPASASEERNETRWRSLDKTGNVRLLVADDLAGGEIEPPAAADPADGEPESRAHDPAAAAEPVAQPQADQPAAEPVAQAQADQPAAESSAALPVPNYDDLSLASLRSRLRNLDPAQLRVLIEYEQAHAGREAVLTMFERRIVKLENSAD